VNDSFIYKSFEVQGDGRTAQFNYEIVRGDKRYDLRETLKFPVPLADPKLSPCLRALHLALGISYYKIFASREITQPYFMDVAEAEFWNTCFEKGLGEYLYVNDLTPEAVAKFKAQDGIRFDSFHINSTGSALLGIGGGKDSIVAGELLKKIGVTTRGFVMATGNQLGQAGSVAEVMGANLDAVERKIDPSLIELQKLPGAHRGHIPISLVFSLVGTTLAAASDTSYVVVGNESSASLPRITAKFGPVNHQWSKSLEAEKLIQTFIHDHICPDITYFSAIRSLSSLAVAKLFARLSQYFEVFTSDNFVFRIDPSKRPDSRWSLESPKSLSSFILLTPWTSESDMLSIFGRNFLDETSLEKLFLELTGQVGEPPLDCVGTVDELVLSLNLAAAQGKFSSSYLVNLAKQRGLIGNHDQTAELTKMIELSPEQALPAELKPTVESALKEELSR
jgi:hypothetical protein